MGVHNMTNYEQEVRNFRLHVPERFNFARDVIGRWAQDPAKLAMHWLSAGGEERKLTFRDFAERSDHFARLLQARGVRPGDRVMVQLPRVPAWCATARNGRLGCSRSIGGTPRRPRPASAATGI